MPITSLVNQKIKNLIKLLEKPRERKKQGLVVVEGKKEIQTALDSGALIVEFFYCSDFGGSAPTKLAGKKVFIEEVCEKIFKKISYRENPDGYLAVFSIKEKKFSDIKLNKNPLIIVLEGTEKPGNLGAVLRSADGAGADAVIINDPKIDIYNPNAIRASRGAIFNLPVIQASHIETIEWLLKNKIKIFATSDKAKKDYIDCDFFGATAFVFGEEHSGLGKQWQKTAAELIKIPMAGISDSLNLSVAVAVILFEAVRQRNKKK